MTYSRYRFFPITILSMFLMAWPVQLIAIGAPGMPSGGHHASSNATLNKMSYKELHAAYLEATKKGNKEAAVKYLEKMIPQCSQVQEAQELLLNLANFHYELQEFSNAQKKYTEYAQLYPGSNHLEFALYRALSACFSLTSSYDRDQSKTEEAITLAHDFLERENSFIVHADEVKKIEHACQMKLLESELAIYDFYCKSKKYASASHRLSLIEKEFSLFVPQNKMLQLKIELAQAQEKSDLADQLREELLKQFPETISSTPTLMAQAKNFTDWF